MQSGCLGSCGVEGLKRPDEELSSPDCVSKCSSIQKDFLNNSWKLCSPKSLFDSPFDAATSAENLLYFSDCLLVHSN